MVAAAGEEIDHCVARHGPHRNARSPAGVTGRVVGDAPHGVRSATSTPGGDRS
jgi:hypothetical protein